MTVEIRGANTQNKGAELMLRATVSALRDEFSLSCAPPGTRYEVRAALGLRQTMQMRQSPVAATRMAELVPEKVKEWYGLVSDDDISGVVDASGFGYSDSFPVIRNKREALRGRRWARRDVPVVFLPQAFGPFDHPAQRRWCGEILGRASLVFCRDATSARYVAELVPDCPSRVAPDLTIITRPPAKVAVPVAGPFAAIVPNIKMIRMGALLRAEYISALAAVGQRANALGLTPLIVVHDVHDAAIAREIGEVLQCGVFSHEDPLILKGVLGRATVAIASRFHAAVGALSMGVPTVVLGWSHKYAALLSDYGVSDWLATPESDLGEAVARTLADKAGHGRLAEEHERLRGCVSCMWKDTVETLLSGGARGL